METDQKTFVKLWEDFILSYKGKLITASNSREISFSSAKQLLSESSLCWTSGQEMCARWLRGLYEESPKRAELINEIITRDMTLNEVKVASSKGNISKIVIPVCVGIVGFAIAKKIFAIKLIGTTITKMFTLRLVGAALMALVVALMAYFIVKGRLSAKHDRERFAIIDDYINQLDKYKKAIEDVLLAE